MQEIGPNFVKLLNRIILNMKNNVKLGLILLSYLKFN